VLTANSADRVIAWPTAPAAAASRSKPTRPSFVEHAFVVTTFLLTMVLNRLLGDLSDVGDRGSLVAQLIWATIYIGAVIGLVVAGRRSIDLMKRSPLALLVVALALVSTIWSEDAQLTLRRSIGLLGTVAFAYYVVARFDLAAFLRVFAWTMAIAACLSAFVVVAMPDFGLMQDAYVGSWRGIFNHKNGLGIAMVLGMLTLIIACPKRPVLAGIVAAGAALLCGVEVAATQSVTSYATAALCAVAAILLLIARSTRIGRIIAIVLVVLASGTLLGALVSGPDVGNALEAIGRESSLTGRTDLWSSAIRAIGDRPFFGFGYDVFWETNGIFLQYNPGAVWAYGSHNGYLEALLDFGLVGGAIIAALIVIGLLRASALAAATSSRAVAWPLLAIIAFVVVNLSEGEIAKDDSFIWITFMIALLYATADRSLMPGGIGSNPSRRTPP
jgi:exopolysaccharide production protein ExoQ